LCKRAVKNESNTTVGLRYDEKDCKVTGVLSGGPAFLSKKIAKGDTLVSINGTQCKGNEKRIPQLFKGKDNEKTFCTLRVLCAKTAKTEDIELQAKHTKKIQYMSRYFVYYELIFCENAAHAGSSDS